ncbi:MULTISPECIES: Cd(II)/Pb(II)-responsive transcriptional regulator [Pseudoalteromonas]|jgi:Cd(II)/Pb(II)-responsive transcriptional regulator|uniref:HTH merR-type domain-containing protein n=2 Tax=Pseudoalteromonas TaxID=53246 RepID=A0A290SCB0_9GAMM|nr:Cd(II)/Pb(II)-responsive transcriptional regulator [Pseudoalteromonas arctica]ATC89045.1 hypothetical protein PARC_p0078 [Pseudoalteromonas arctica A 37-1-2]|tara:strand:- start:121 stop:510 length:390 start_codon:yes stop_codon:yes gene_type:complete
MKIGDVAKTTGCSIQTIRFYEKKGLLPELKRSSGNYRVYDKGTIEQLLFIKQCRSLDMSIMEVKTLMGSRSRPDQSCSNINTLIAKHLSDVIIRIEELNVLKSSLENMASSCDQDKTIRDCGILNYLHT